MASSEVTATVTSAGVQLRLPKLSTTLRRKMYGPTMLASKRGAMTLLLGTKVETEPLGCSTVHS